jgi:hypothetical protein
MRRRELLKALAAVPFATAMGGCDEKHDDEKKQDEKHSSTVEVHLYGAIALVMQRNKGNSLLAFSPKPPSGEEHQFYLNDSRKPEGGGKSLTFKLSPEGLEREKKTPEINPGLNDFFFQTEKWRVGDALLTIELPPPDKITFIGPRSSVAFKADKSRVVWMPTNHVLKYELHGAAARLECSDRSVNCAPSPDSYPGVTRFFFEIGPARTLNYAQSHDHAIRFFNYILKQCFPDLAQKYSLDENPYGRQQALAAPRLAPAVFQYGRPFARLQPASYITDCEYAGPLVGSSSSPTG